MTTSTDIFRRAGADATRDEQARQAVIEGRKLVSTLTSYARALTKDPSVSVEMATRDNGSTNGKRIFWRPPMALGDRTPHQRSLCNRRDENLQQLCSSCAKREEVLAIIYHEIAHICFESFQEVVEGDRVNLIKDAIETTGGKYADAIKRKIEAAPYYAKNSYISMASLINEFLPLIFNALEDARVNRELFKVRKGTKSMFDALCAKTFSEGVEQLDAYGNVTVIEWRDYPLNAQAIVGLFAKASGYTYDNWFQPNVVDALNDPQLTALVNQLNTIRSAQGVYHLGFPVLARLRELGFCKLPDDPEEEPEPQPEGPSEDKSDDEGSSGEDESGDSDLGDSDSEPGESDGESGDREDSDSADDQDSSEEGDTSEADEAGDAGSDGEDPDSGTSDDGGPEPDGGDGASSADPSSDDSEDESGDPSGMGEPDNSEEMDDGTDDAESGSGASGADGSTGEAGDNPSGESDSTEPGSAPESNRGTGDISGPPLPSDEDERVDEETDRLGSDSPGDTGDPVGEPESADSSDAGEPEPGDGDSPGSSLPTEPPSGDGERGEEAESEPVEPGEDRGDLTTDDEDEAIDTGAAPDSGTEVVENAANDDKPMPEPGDAEDAKTALLKLGDHEETPKRVYEEEANADAIDRAIVQGIYFETPSRFIYGVREHRFDKPIIVEGENLSQAWNHSAWYYAGHSKAQLGIDGDFDPSEQILGPALIRMRVAFSDNARGKSQAHLKSGRVNGRVLGRRAWTDDERLFRRSIQPGKKSYFVLIGMDISGSTLGRNIILEKRAVMAQAELCHRMGVKFAVIAHTGNYHKPGGSRADGLDLDMYIIKDATQPWNEETKEALRKIGPDSANLDGHSLEYYRKMIQKRPETDKIIMYYSDGKMPAENHDEELMILQREIKTCKRLGIVLMGVGIRTDSPVRHGLDTVQVDDDQDIAKVVRHLEKKLSVHTSTG